MAASKQSFYTLSARLNEEKYLQFLKNSKGFSKSNYVRLCLFGKNAGKGRQSRRLTQAERQVYAKMLALLGKSRLFSNINQIAHHMNCGTFKLSPASEAAILELENDIKYICNNLKHPLGKKAPPS